MFRKIVASIAKNIRKPYTKALAIPEVYRLFKKSQELGVQFTSSFIKAHNEGLYWQSQRKACLLNRETGGLDALISDACERFRDITYEHKKGWKKSDPRKSVGKMKNIALDEALDEVHRLFMLAQAEGVPFTRTYLRMKNKQLYMQASMKKYALYDRVRGVKGLVRAALEVHPDIHYYGDLA